MPAEILDSYPMPLFFGDRYIWPSLQARAVAGGAAKLYEQARVMGGGSSINVQAANRGLPRDYDEWAASGAPGWSWQDVLPFFRKLERDVDFASSPMHGSDGPVPIRRIPPQAWPPFCTAFAQAMGRSGLSALDDQNAEFGDGWFPAAFSNVDGKRVSTAIAYLDAHTRKRTNLRIFAETTVKELVVSGREARGVIAVRADGARLALEAGEVIVSAGALQSPAILMRAGIGDAVALQALGIEVVADRPGVGRNLQDHPALTFCQFLAPEYRMPLSRRRSSMTAARFSSEVPGGEASDMYFSSSTRAGWHALGNRLGLFFLWCNRPFSCGQVSLAGAQPDVPPMVELNLLDDERDLRRMVAGVRRLVRIVGASALYQHPDDFFPAMFSPRVKALSRVSRGNALLTGLLGALLDVSGPLRRSLIARFVTGGANLASLLADESALEGFVRQSVFGVWHASGTCRMGAHADRSAVTDATGRVHDVGRLRVVDASLMPRLPTANTNIPTIMLAEKIADAMLAERRATRRALSEVADPG